MHLKAETLQPYRIEVSNSVIVTNGHGPHLRIYGPQYGQTEDKACIDRLFIAEQVRDIMNRDMDRPAWFADLFRQDEQTLIGAWGLSIEAAGPFIDPKGTLAWEQNETPEAKDQRARLIDRLTIGR